MKVTSGCLVAICSTLLNFAAGDSTFTPARPPAIPIGVKSPYLSTWQQAGSDGGNGGFLAGQWTTFWAGQVTAWTGMIRVDGTTYTWMGDPGPQSVTQTAFEYTATRSMFTMDVGGLVEMNITFLSPLTPSDQQRQSLIFTYLDVGVSSLDGATHDVQLYTDISAEWVAGDHGSVAQWDFGTTSDDILYHKVFRQTQLLFSETNDQADWGNWYYGTKNTSSLSFQSGQDVVVRGAFESNGSLANTQDSDFRPIDQDWPVFGFSTDLGSLSGSVNTLYTIGLTQEQAIQFDGATGIIPLNSLWTSYFSSETDALSFFYNDYDNASTTADAFDQQIVTDATTAAGPDYVTITSLAARQAFGAVQLVGNLTKNYLFLKEISSDGNVQTVDVIFPFHPILLYLGKANLLKLLLDPLFENQESGQYPNMYSMHDLGSSYPNATGHPLGNDEAQPLEECGNMLIMTLAYAQRANDNAYLTQHYNILKQWTTFLVEEALIPANQISTDDFAGSLANQTNLALKGIIGIEAFAVIANLTGNAADAQNYTDIAHSYIDQWQVFGIAQDATPPHTTLGYGLNDTHGLLYNLYGDTELGLGLVPQSVYDMQSDFYPTVFDTYGVPLDTRHNYTKNDWEIFTASIASDSTRDLFISAVANWIGQTTTARPETDWYDAVAGGWPVDGGQFTARPVVGGHFALLALKDAPSPANRR